MLAPALLFGLLIAGAPAVQAQPAAGDCGDWEDCRDKTQAAMAADEFETAHDLAWRMVQRGPANDPALLFVLARAQCLSGRADDALVMLGRIAASGVAAEALTDEDFRRTRDLPGWPDVEARLRSALAADDTEVTKAADATDATDDTDATKVADDVDGADVSGLVTPKPDDVAEPASPKPDDVAEPASPKPEGRRREAARFNVPRFSAGGLAYDAVSGRFLFGDREGRKLLVARDGVDHAVVYVRAESAGFDNVVGLEIDVPRGDLWVVSADAERGQTRLHKIQLISGRPLEVVDVPAELGDVEIVDLAIGPDGTVMGLDRAGGQLLVLPPKSKTVQVVEKAEVESPLSLAWSRTASVVYVATSEGLSRVDVGSGKVAAVEGPDGETLGGFERLRRHGRELVGIQRTGGGRQIVRLTLNASGRRVTEVTRLDAEVSTGGGPVFATVSGDDFAYWVDPTADSAETGMTDVVVYRVTLD